MERARQALEGLLNYDEAAAIRPLETVPVEKNEIPRYVVCPGYERAQSRLERSMERYTARVAQAEERHRQSKQNIAELEDAVEQWAGKAKGIGSMDGYMSVMTPGWMSTTKLRSNLGLFTA